MAYYVLRRFRSWWCTLLLAYVHRWNNFKKVEKLHLISPWSQHEACSTPYIGTGSNVVLTKVSVSCEKACRFSYVLSQPSISVLPAVELRKTFNRTLCTIHTYDLQSANIITCVLSHTSCHEHRRNSSKASHHVAHQMKLYYLRLAKNKMVSVLAVFRCTVASTHRILIENILANFGASGVLGFGIMGEVKSSESDFYFLRFQSQSFPEGENQHSCERERVKYDWNCSFKIVYLFSLSHTCWHWHFDSYSI